MKCPLDDSDLVMSERQGIEIDYCPRCRGVWLDRGELDKIIERAADAVPSSQADRSEPARGRETPRETRPSFLRPASHDDDDDDRRSGKPYRKKKSLLDDLFDF